MWLVSGIDEEHRFPRWTEAADFYRQIVGDWVAAHEDPDTAAARELATSLHDLPLGQAHQVGFPSGSDGAEAVRFELSWEVPTVGLDHYTAC
jgi:hypothetical protein